MFRAGIYRKSREEGASRKTLIGFVEFKSKVYRDWFLEIVNAFCEDDFEHGNILDCRHFADSCGMPVDFESWVTDERACTVYDLSLCPRGAVSMWWSSFYYHDFTEIVCASFWIQEGLCFNPRAEMSDLVRVYVDEVVKHKGYEVVR